MDASREDVLTYMDYPKEHWAQIASTNPLERLNRTSWAVCVQGIDYVEEGGKPA
jgi:transposase-like protein